MSRTIKCTSFWDALVLRLILEEHGAQVDHSDEGPVLSMVVSGTLDGIKAAVTQLSREFPRAGPVVIESKDSAIHTEAIPPRTGPAVHGAIPGGAEGVGIVSGSSPDSRPVAGVVSAHETGDLDSPLNSEVVIVPGEVRYHRSCCILIRLLSSEDLKTLARQKAEADGYVPCQACEPDKPPSART